MIWNELLLTFLAFQHNNDQHYESKQALKKICNPTVLINMSICSTRMELLCLTNLCCFFIVCLLSGNLQTHLYPSASNKSSSITTWEIKPVLFVIGISAFWQIITMILLESSKTEERVTEQDPDLYDWCTSSPLKEGGGHEWGGRGVHRDVNRAIFGAHCGLMET